MKWRSQGKPPGLAEVGRDSGQSTSGGKGEHLSEKRTFKLTAESFKNPVMRRGGRGGHSQQREKHMLRSQTWATGLRPPAPSCPNLFLEGFPSALLTTASYPRTGKRCFIASKELPHNHL